MTLVAQYTVYVWIPSEEEAQTDAERDTAVNTKLEQIEEVLKTIPDLKEFEFEELHVW